MPGALGLWLWLWLALSLWLWLAVSPTHSLTHTDMDTPHSPWRATPAPRPPSPRALCPHPGSSEPALPDPALRKARSRGASESVRPSGSCGPPCLGGETGAGAAVLSRCGCRRGLTNPAGVAPARFRPSCTHPQPRWPLTGFPAREGSARKSEASGDRGHLVPGRSCPGKGWGGGDAPVNKTPLPQAAPPGAGRVRRPQESTLAVQEDRGRGLGSQQWR